MTAELSARRTAAAAAAADFTREVDAYLDSGASRPDFDSWAWRLLTELRLVLDGLADEDRLSRAASHVRSDGSAVLSHDDLMVVLGALSDAAAYGSDPVACRGLAYRLGDDRG